MGESLCRGTTEGANCLVCPFANAGKPNKPVVSEFPEDPAFLIIGEGPGHFEVRAGRPFVGPSGQVVNQVLHKIGRPREHVYIGNATLCIPPQGTPVEVREFAAACCKPRLLNELAWFPNKPILTLGAVAAHAVIPKATLDQIDPPDVPKSKKKAQKEKKRLSKKTERKHKLAIERVAIQRYYQMYKHWKKELFHQIRRQTGKKPSENYLNQPEQVAVTKALWKKARVEAPQVLEAQKKERELARLNKPKGPPKKKKIKITDIIGTLFDVDCGDGSIRPVIPAIHPAALLHGGGATIGGSHTPDMAIVNLTYDAAKVNSLAKGKDIRLKIDFAFEVDDAEKATWLFVEALQAALDEGECTIDLETYVEDVERHHALMSYEARIRVVGIATRNRSIAVLWEFLPNWALRYFQLVLMKCSLGFHHGLYDRTVLRNKHHQFVVPVYGIDEDVGYRDSLYAHHAAFPGNSHRLQTVTAQFFGVHAWKAEFRNQDETPDKLAKYCANDTGGTEALLNPLEVWVKRTETERVYDIDRRMADIASRMHLVGQPVSKAVNSQLVRTFSKLAHDSRERVERQANDKVVLEEIKHKLALLLAAKKRKKDDLHLQPLRQLAQESGHKLAEFDEQTALYEIRKRELDDEDWCWKINNSKHIAALLQAMDVALTTMTDAGVVSTKREVLEALVHVPVVRDMLEYRENNKMLDFTAPIFDRLGADGSIESCGFADQDHRIHPIWSIHKISGRWAGTEPMGTSNPPREKTKKVPFGSTIHADTIVTNYICECGGYKSGKHEGHEYKPKFVEIAYRPTTKRQIVAPRGRVIVGFDFSQVEARIIALISGDEFMCDVFATGRDLHKECARVVFPGFDDKTPSEQKMARTVCKTLEYATFYGANDEKVWKGLLKEGYNFRLPDVSGSLNTLRRKMSYVVQWQRDTIARASQPPFTLRDFILGRRRVWAMGQVEASEALNIVPQSTGAALMDTGMAAMDQRLVKYREAFWISQIHDAAYVECWEDDASKIERDFKECFECEHTNPKTGKTVRFPIETGIASSMHEV